MNSSELTANRSIDLNEVRPVAFDGGTAILARTYRTTTFGIEIDASEVLVGVPG